MSFGSDQWQEWVLNEEESLPLLEHAFKVGLNTWDTVNHNRSVSSNPNTHSSIAAVLVANVQ